MSFEVIKVQKQITFKITPLHPVTGALIRNVAHMSDNIVGAYGNKEEQTLCVQVCADTHEEMEDSEMELYQRLTDYFE